MRDSIRRVVIFHFVLELYIFFLLLLFGGAIYVFFFFFFFGLGYNFCFFYFAPLPKSGYVYYLFPSTTINSINKIKETN